MSFGMPLGSLSRESVLRGVAVVAITTAVTLAAACSDEDTVDTIPPPWPDRTTSHATAPAAGPSHTTSPVTTSTGASTASVP